MNFSLVSTDRTNFTLSQESNEIATIKYNARSQSVRLHSNERRVFFLEQVGLLQNKILLKTEYGVQIGENYHIKHQHKGIFHLSKDKFSYWIEQNAIRIADKRRQIMASFSFENAKALDSYELSTLLFSLAWMLTNGQISAATAHKASGLYVS
jgi:hypothetical protein